MFDGGELDQHLFYPKRSKSIGSRIPPPQFRELWIRLEEYKEKPWWELLRAGDDNDHHRPHHMSISFTASSTTITSRWSLSLFIFTIWVTVMLH
jgi:hypothetical protein